MYITYIIYGKKIKNDGNQKTKHGIVVFGNLTTATGCQDADFFPDICIYIYS